MNDILIHILDLQSDDIQNVFTITIYGKTNEGKNIVCHVKDFKPFFYVKIPEKWSKNTFESNIIKSINYNLKFWEKKYINVDIKPPKYYNDVIGRTARITRDAHRWQTKSHPSGVQDTAIKFHFFQFSTKK